MARVTSIMAWNKIKDSKMLSFQRWAVYDTVFWNGPMTSAEAFKIIDKEKPDFKIVLNSRARFTECRDRGVLYEKGWRKCSVTGQTVIEWEVTTKLPIKPPKRKTRKMIKDEIHAILDKSLRSILMTEDQRKDLEHCYFLIYDL